jgi:hypothetical protein
MKTSEIIQKLEQKFCLPKWSFISEVPVQMQFGRIERRIDGVAVCNHDVLKKCKCKTCFPYQKGDVIGFELKASRNDWLAELKQPDKLAETICVCDYYYIVATVDVLVPNELAEIVGWIDPETMIVQKEARKNIRVLDNRTLFYTSLIRRSVFANQKLRAIERIIKFGQYDETQLERLIETQERTLEIGSS